MPKQITTIVSGYGKPTQRTWLENMP